MLFRSIEEGKEEGIKAGEKKKAIEIAKGLLDILSIEIIAQKTGLTVDEVKALKDEVKSIIDGGSTPPFLCIFIYSTNFDK